VKLFLACDGTNIAVFFIF